MGADENYKERLRIAKELHEEELRAEKRMAFEQRVPFYYLFFKFCWWWFKVCAYLTFYPFLLLFFQTGKPRFRKYRIWEYIWWIFSLPVLLFASYVFIDDPTYFVNMGCTEITGRIIAICIGIIPLFAFIHVIIRNVKQRKTEKEKKDSRSENKNTTEKK